MMNKLKYLFKYSAKALYIHIPFCDHICSYCDFNKFKADTSKKDVYLKTLIKDLDLIKKNNLDTIFIGGGTPSSLNDSELIYLLSYLKRFKNVKEFTLEANPENLDLEKINILKKYGVNRISLGVQSLNNQSLEILNRQHNEGKVAEVVFNLHKIGINNINLDFIYGLKNENQNDYLKHIKFAFDNKVTHISYYSLQLEKGTKLYLRNDLIKSDDEIANDYFYIVNKLKKFGFSQYEVSNFAKKGYESLHNLTYWLNKSYYGVGISATGYLNHIRYKNTSSFLQYINNKNLFSELHKEDKKEQEFDYLMLHLRLIKGFKISEFNRLFKKDFLKDYKNEISEIKDLILIKHGRFAVKPKNIYILDTILVGLLKDFE